MRAAVVTRFGGPEVLEIRDEPEPEPGPGDLLVAPEAIGVNYRDIYEREGRYGGEAPLVNGVEGAGTVVAGRREGERVAWLSAPGSYAERVVVAEERAVSSVTSASIVSIPRCRAIATRWCPSMMK